MSAQDAEARAYAAFLTSPIGPGSFQTWSTPSGENPQGAFLTAAAIFRKIVFRSGNRVGKTTIGAVNAIMLACGWHPWAAGNGMPVPNHGWISTLSWDFCAEVIWPILLSYLPMDQVAGIAYRRQGQKPIPDKVVFRNGSTITFKSAEQKRAKYQGASLNWLWFDEEHPGEIVEEGRARLVDQRGHLFVTLTPVMRARWVSELEREKGVFVSRASMLQAADAGILPMDEVLDYARSLPERQRRVRVHGEFVALEGLVYGDFSRITHCARVRGDRLVLGDVEWPWPLPKSWPRRAAIDFGFSNPTAIPLAVQDPFHNRLIITQVLYAPQIRATVWAKHIKRLLPPLVRPMAADHDAFARAELEGEGVPTAAAQKDVDSGLEAVERLMMPCGDGAPGLVLVIHPGLLDGKLGRIDAEKLAWELEAYHYPEKKDDKPDPKDAPVKKDDHACDALRYMVKDWEASRGGAPLPPNTTTRVATRTESEMAPSWPVSLDED